MKPTAWMLGLAFAGMCAAAASVAQSPLLRCDDRPTSIDKPWTNTYVVPCLEELALDGAGEALRYALLAAGPDDALYAARPLQGEILRLSDSDSDGLPDRAEVWASGLPLLTGMAFDGQALYVVSGARLVRVQGGVVSTLRDDLPVAPGLWAGGLALGQLAGDPAPRVWIGIRPTCTACNDVLRRRGGVVSVDLNGADMRTEAVGLYAPADLVIDDGRLWLVDSAPPTDPAAPDELNVLAPGADFGYPDCPGGEAAAGSVACRGVTPPVRIFPAGSQPAALLFYRDDALPGLAGRMLLALGGVSGRPALTGYQILIVDADGAAAPTVLMPFASSTDPALTSLSTAQINWRGVGLYPWRPLDMVVNQQGWVYISLAGGRILALRPQAEESS